MGASGRDLSPLIPPSEIERAAPALMNGILCHRSKPPERRRVAVKRGWKSTAASGRALPSVRWRTAVRFAGAFPFGPTLDPGRFPADTVQQVSTPTPEVHSHSRRSAPREQPHSAFVRTNLPLHATRSAAFDQGHHFVDRQARKVAGDRVLQARSRYSELQGVAVGRQVQQAID